jgi:hypothetical protein
MDGFARPLELIRELVKMADVRVTCVTKPNRNSPHEHITHLGGPKWVWPREQVIRSIEEESNSFFTYEAGKRAEIRVHERNGVKYVQTVADGAWTDNLLALNECPIG